MIYIPIEAEHDSCDGCVWEKKFHDEEPCVNCKFNTSNEEDVDYFNAVEATEEHVNHPNHYNREGAYECIDEMILMFGLEDVATFCKLNVWKYRYRAADKNGSEDMAKSDFYVKLYERIKNEISRISR